MDLQYIFENLNILQHNNICLSAVEVIKLKNSLIILGSRNKIIHVFFWGKIYGSEGDYYIVFGFNDECLKGRRFYYSQNGLDWFLLPKPLEECKLPTLKCTTMFTGDPSVEVEVDVDPEFSFKKGKLLQERPHKSFRLSEEQRLACAVKLITDESALVPRGAVCNRTNSIVELNSMFHGLKPDEAQLLSNYQLYREPKQKYNYNLLKRQHFNYNTDFLDTLDDMVPRMKSFSINMECHDEIVVIRSLHWPGMTFYHKINTALHGFVYFGHARMNTDILFNQI